MELHFEQRNAKHEFLKSFRKEISINDIVELIKEREENIPFNSRSRVAEKCHSECFQMSINFNENNYG